MIKKIEYKFIFTLAIYISSSVNMTIIILGYFFPHWFVFCIFSTLIFFPANTLHIFFPSAPYTCLWWVVAFFFFSDSENFLKIILSKVLCLPQLPGWREFLGMLQRGKPRQKVAVSWVEGTHLGGQHRETWGQHFREKSNTENSRDLQGVHLENSIEYGWHMGMRKFPEAKERIKPKD